MLRLKQQNELPRALFLAYGNMFTFIRPVETLIHMRVSQVVLLHTGMNIFVGTLAKLDYSWNYGHNSI